MDDNKKVEWNAEMGKVEQATHLCSEPFPTSKDGAEVEMLHPVPNPKLLALFHNFCRKFECI
jgi:hypothetical protein